MGESRTLIPPFLHGETQWEWDCWFVPSSEIDYAWRCYICRLLSCLKMPHDIIGHVMFDEHYPWQVPVQMVENYGTEKTIRGLRRLFGRSNDPDDKRRRFTETKTAEYYEKEAAKKNQESVEDFWRQECVPCSQLAVAVQEHQWEDDF